jgi:CHAT domain-containing protein
LKIRRSLTIVGIAAGGGVLLCAGFVFWNPASPSRPRHPNSNDPRELLEEADHLFWLNNAVEAQPLYARAEQLFKARGDSRNAFYAKVSQIPADMERGNLADLSQYLAKELRRRGIQQDPYLHLRLLVVKGEVDLNLDALSSQPVWKEVESLASSMGERQLASRASGELGILAFLAGNNLEAQSRVGKALLYAKVTKDVGAEIRYLSMIGQAFAEVGRSEEALKYLDQALKMAARNPDTGFPRLATIGKASALTTAGRYAEARALLNRALEFAKTKGLTGYEVDVLAQDGVLAAKGGDTRNAIRLYEQAARMAYTLHFLRATAEVESQLAALYEKAGDLKHALECAAQSADAHRSLGETYALPHHFAVQAGLLAKLGRPHDAERLFSKAADVTEAMLLNAQNATNARRTLIAAMSEVYVGYFALEADKLRDFDKAFQVIEEARGRVAADSLRTHPQADPSASEAPSPVELRIASLNSRLLDSDQPAERARIMDEVFEAEQELIIEDSPRVRERPVPLQTLQRDLRVDEILLEYVLSEPESYCLVITRHDVSLAKLAPRQTIRKLVADYRNSISKRDDEHRLSGLLASTLLAPIKQYARSPDVVIVPDGALNLIPFEALWSDGEGYALHRHSFTVVPSGTVLHLLRKEQSKPAPLAFLGVSAPEPAGSTKKPTPHAGLEIFRELLEIRRSELAALPATEMEVKSIAKLMGAGTRVLMRDQATEAAFKSEPLADLRVIHLALHGLADTTFPDRSALVFSAGGRPEEDGLLQAREIRKLPINAELVTLSACDAGVGRIEGEEGVSSLVEAFLNAGARSVVASLWPAEDTYTKGLMEAFYRHLVQGETKKEALRQAKMDMLREFGDAVPPLYWAGFVLVGDGNGRVALGGGS